MLKIVSSIQRAAAVGFLWLVPMLGHASAQVSISGNYYEEVKSNSCTGSSTACILAFTATPQLVLFTDVSCSFALGSQPSHAGFSVSDTANGLSRRRTEHFPLQLVSTNNYAAKFKTTFLFGSGKYPTIFVFMIGANTS